MSRKSVMSIVLLVMLALVVCLISGCSQNKAPEATATVTQAVTEAPVTEETAEEAAVAEAATEEAAPEEPAALPQQVAAKSVDEFLGDWNMSGIIYEGAYYNKEMMLANKYIAEASDRIFTVTADKADLTYLGSVMSFTVVMNDADGTLIIKNDQSKAIISLYDDGTIGMQEDGADIISFFTKVVKEEAAE